MEYCNIFIAEYQYNQYNNNIIVPSAAFNYFLTKKLDCGSAVWRGFILRENV